MGSCKEGRDHSHGSMIQAIVGHKILKGLSAVIACALL